MVAAQLVLRLERNCREYRGLLLVQRHYLYDMKRFFIYNYSAMVLYAPMSRQLVSARGRHFIPTGKFQDRSDQ